MSTIESGVSGATYAPEEVGGYSVYVKTHDDKLQIQAVKNGFCWPAAFFGAIWAWTKGMVGVGFGLLFLAIIIKLLGLGLEGGAGIAGLFLDLVISIAFFIWIGHSANGWRKASLKEKGFALARRYADVSSPSEAIERYKQGAPSHEAETSGADVSEPPRPIPELPGPKGQCPNCDRIIPLAASECPKCEAQFTGEAVWRVRPVGN